MPSFLDRIRRSLAKLRQRTTWAIFTGIVQAFARHVADSFGWPAVFTLVFVTGGAVVIDFLSSVPSPWVWFVALVALTLGIPPTIRASAELRRATADLINAATKKQELDQPEKGPPKTEIGNESRNEQSAERLERIYARGQALLESGPKPRPGEWRQNIIAWFQESETAVNDDAPKEAFMYRTISHQPKPDEKLDDCSKLLAARLVKLRSVIGRLQ